MRLAFFVAPLAATVPLIAVAQQDFSDLNQVIVTASRLAEPLDDAIASVTVITRADIDRLQPRSVDELLSGLAGITVSNDGDLGKTTSVFVRGTNSDHVLVLIDGLFCQVNVLRSGDTGSVLFRIGRSQIHARALILRV